MFDQLGTWFFKQRNMQSLIVKKKSNTMPTIIIVLSPHPPVIDAHSEILYDVPLLLGTYNKTYISQPWEKYSSFIKQYHRQMVLSEKLI